jgi:hypothetical protein
MEDQILLHDLLITHMNNALFTLATKAREYISIGLQGSRDAKGAVQTRRPVAVAAGPHKTRSRVEREWMYYPWLNLVGVQEEGMSGM